MIKYIIYMFLAACVLGCREQSPEALDIDYRKTMELYQNGSILQAENALKSFQQRLRVELKNKPDNVDYRTLNGLLWMRLYSIYNYKEDRGLARDAIENSARLLVGSEDKVDEVMKTLEALEREATPAWKKDLKRQP